MTSTECRLRNASAVAGKVWSVAAGVLMHGPLAPTGAVRRLGDNCDTTRMPEPVSR
jgi:hypothetical protein